MAGHSKWANIKHKKAKEDAKKGRMFTKIARQITAAVREGGPDPESNFRLRLAIDNARQINMPNDNIERAIARGSGAQDGGNYDEVVYEGYGPNGVAILLEALTDNRNRTAGELRYVFSKFGGNLGESGCVAWMFQKKGLIVLDKEGLDEDEVMMTALEAGAEDVETDDEMIRIITSPSEYTSVRDALKDAGYQLSVAEITQIPDSEVEISEEDAEKIEELIDSLEDLDDVQNVYSNYRTS